VQYLSKVAFVNQVERFASPANNSLKEPLDERDWKFLAFSKCRTSWSKGPDATDSALSSLQAIASYLEKEKFHKTV
jgi:hypothetical protein